MLKLKLPGKARIAAAVAIIAATAVTADNIPVLRSRSDSVTVWLDGNQRRSETWVIDPAARPDVLETTAAAVTFASDRDTLTVAPAEWGSADLVIVNARGDSALTRVTRIAANPFENPSQEMLRKAPSGLLSREQAEFDIRALVYAISEIHPGMYSACPQTDFHRAVNRAVAALPDSVSVAELYLAAAPLAAMLGDGHTNLYFPAKEVFTPELKRRPFFTTLLPDRSIRCAGSADGLIPAGSEIASVNGRTARELIGAMLPYVAGEREHFRIACLDGMVADGLEHLLFPADTFKVEFRAPGAIATETVEMPGLPHEQLMKRCARTGKANGRKPDYSYAIDSENGVAVMDFRAFHDPRRMGQFADSMFRDLREKGIRRLVIDIRENSGGNSALGDTLLRYLSPIPFAQFDKILCRVTPLSAKIIGPGISPGIYFHEASEDDLITPRTPDEGHFDGNVYLLTSNYTFSSAADFSWAFKEAGCGTVVGEETGGVSVCYGDVLTYRLPVSGLRATISYKRFWQFRANENDIHGTLPDVAVPAPDALSTALRLIRDR